MQALTHSFLVRAARRLCGSDSLKVIWRNFLANLNIVSRFRAKVQRFTCHVIAERACCDALSYIAIALGACRDQSGKCPSPTGATPPAKNPTADRETGVPCPRCGRAVILEKTFVVLRTTRKH